MKDSIPLKETESATKVGVTEFIEKPGTKSPDTSELMQEWPNGVKTVNKITIEVISRSIFKSPQNLLHLHHFYNQREAYAMGLGS